MHAGGMMPATAKLWLAVALAAALSGAAWWAYNAIYDQGADSVQVKWDAVELERSQQSAKVAADALQTTKDLQATTEQLRKTSHAQISALNQSLAAAIAGLSNRPARPDAGSVPGDTTAGAGCTGAGLYRPDAEFLARESARADKLRVDIAQCQSQYNAARAALMGGK